MKNPSTLPVRDVGSRDRSGLVAIKGKTSTILRDHERGAKPAIKFHPKRMAMQAAPDHGDHE
jgi:hypothetical protein